MTSSTPSSVDSAVASPSSPSLAKTSSLSHTASSAGGNVGPSPGGSPGDGSLEQVLHATLRRYWGYESLRPLQVEAMGRVMAGRDSLVVLPTGGGKSLCFQLPALCQEGLALVVSPLISLMKDQVDSLRGCGIPAAYINSSLSTQQRREVADQVQRRELKLLYVAPERLLAGRTLEFLQTAGLSLIAIDEAHCISSWGHDFRPEYRGLKVLKQRFPQLGVHAYTATAAPRIQRDIVQQLALVDPAILVGGVDRPNLTYRAIPASDRLGQICRVIARHANQSGIIYCISRKEAETTAAFLSEIGYRAAPYHAGLPTSVRKRNQDAFLREEVHIIVATVAFGMGIDKPNVRFVIHARMPKSLEHFQQESGRAGRDGLPAECVLLHSPGDVVAWKKMLEKDSPAEYREAKRELDLMWNFCQRATCRHAAIVQYFGQRLNHANCGACDFCLGELESNSAQGYSGSLGGLSSSSPYYVGVTAENSFAAKGLTTAALTALKLFRDGVGIEEVGRRLQRARSTTLGYLHQYIRLDGITDWSRWVDPEAGRRIELALPHMTDNRLKPLFEFLQGEISYDDIRIVLLCLGNQRSQT
jgi:RecQ family ATP-dependent DNA helicase